ncbi:acetylornithine transaminase [Pseudonocardia sp. KRD-184]|uniref:Acetylornithine aminotransferase n=1 Tax=Pseudonocardia oceani TaxID=2792013 RepID=A0ABS6UH71_9PSEU|nr:acetylornithine transaminase [Pseudonocardia oceani]MBW0089829.1 acetylornithine transaminase [Pseudonocardia oceani]MBW0096888.1 acetylornithine transaminase [Pseudonocardia oceani]MBW0109588.1 acetylornithine transaminase [Pseudonocardia oceani]MBW0123685.1 acetylornithine transaminase [Pseudonocardia oceani]MBW0131602.1 acetylornithine transaminase [Pseudonocardia oceani]
MTTHAERWQHALMDNYGTPPLILVRGSGAEVWDADGRRYLDLLGGIAVNALGHAHPAVVEAVTTQLSTLGHTSNLYITEPPLALAEKLLELLDAPDARVLFCNSGAEANEAAFKIARRTGRPGVVACEGAFHGRTMGALALTGQPPKRAPFEPLVPGVTHIPFGDVAALDAAVTSDTAAVFLEPIMGEAGVVVPPEGYLRAAREITAARGALLVLDEVQTGIGRTGAWFAHQAAGFVPDVVTLAKGLGGGLPIGACIGIGAAASLLEPGQHGTTFGGNPVCCAAALAVLATIASDGLLEQVSLVGKTIAAGVEDLAHPLVSGVSGAGLHIGIGLTQPVSAAVASAARDAGFLVNNAVPDRVRLAPPLVLTEAQAGEFLTALPGILDRAGEGGPT